MTVSQYHQAFTPRKRIGIALGPAALCFAPRPAAAQMPPPTGAVGACTIVGPLLGPGDFPVPTGQPPYGQFDPQVGGTINLARCPEPVRGA